MRLDKCKERCITIDAFYELAERESELWELVDRPAGPENEALREMLLDLWQEFKRSLMAEQKKSGELPTREEVIRMFRDSFEQAPLSFPNHLNAKARLS